MKIFIVLWSLISLGACVGESGSDHPTVENPTDTLAKKDTTMTSTAMTDTLYYLALGDSYTIGESVEEAERYPVQLVSRLRKADVKIAEPTIIARTGWTTRQLKQAIANADLREKYELVSLLIGVNNQYQGINMEVYKTEFRELLKKAIELAGGNTRRVFVVSIPDYAYTPFGRNSSTISKQIDEYNAVNLSITREYGIAYFDITPISRKGLEQPDLVASDGLHPSGKMYTQWVQIMYNEVENKLKN
jgi:lysophospholipase L1-like esterase